VPNHNDEPYVLEQPLEPFHLSRGDVGKLSVQVFTSESGELCTYTVPMKTLRDDELVELVKNGCQEAFGELHKRYKRRLLVCAERITRNSEDGEDAVQEAFLKAFLRIGDFAGRSSFSTWLTRILINTCIMQLRKRREHLYISLGCVHTSAGLPQ